MDRKKGRVVVVLARRPGLFGTFEARLERFEKRTERGDVKEESLEVKEGRAGELLLKLLEFEEEEDILCGVAYVC